MTRWHDVLRKVRCFSPVQRMTRVALSRHSSLHRACPLCAISRLMHRTKSGRLHDSILEAPVRRQHLFGIPILAQITCAGLATRKRAHRSCYYAALGDRDDATPMMRRPPPHTACTPFACRRSIVFD
jgi:hypothetical protein